VGKIGAFYCRNERNRERIVRSTDTLLQQVVVAPVGSIGNPILKAVEQLSVGISLVSEILISKMWLTD
jgi:hypothetical protein